MYDHPYCECSVRHFVFAQKVKGERGTLFFSLLTFHGRLMDDGKSHDSHHRGIQKSEYLSEELYKRVMALVIVNMKTSSNLANLARIRAFIRKHMPRDMMDEHGLAHVELGAQEAASNIMIHAYKGKLEQPVWVNVETSREQIHIRLYHTGIALNPEDVKIPAFDGSLEGGFGLYISGY